MFNPKITREIIDKKIIYKKINGNIIISNKDMIEKLNKLAIPPAWKNVLIDVKKNAKLLVTGIDAKGKKQYIYSQKHIKETSDKKFKNLINFGKKYNLMQKTIDNYISQKRNGIKKLIGIIIKLMFVCNFRIGTEYCYDNYGSIGINTVMKKHLTFKNNGLQIQFIGKKGVENICLIKNEYESLINEIKNIYDSKTNENDFIFEYNSQKVVYSDVHSFLKNKFGVTSKDIRTWNANVILLSEIKKLYKNYDKSKSKSRSLYKKVLKEALTNTSIKMHHTVAIAKKNYLLSDIINIFIEKPRKFKRLFLNNNDDKQNFFNYLKIKFKK